MCAGLFCYLCIVLNSNCRVSDFVNFWMWIGLLVVSSGVLLRRILNSFEFIGKSCERVLASFHASCFFWHIFTGFGALGAGLIFELGEGVWRRSLGIDASLIFRVPPIQNSNNMMCVQVRTYSCFYVNHVVMNLDAAISSTITVYISAQQV